MAKQQSVDNSNVPAHWLDSPLPVLSTDDRRRLCVACLNGVVAEADEWVAAAARAKGYSHESATSAEDLLSGPVVVARQLQLTIQTLQHIHAGQMPVLPGKPQRLTNGQIAVPVFPTRGFFDSLTFMGLTGHVWMAHGVEPSNLHGELIQEIRSARIAGIAVVLGAGNVSSIPATDSLNKIMFEGRRVILKMNPVNEYLAPIFERAFHSLIAANLLKIVTGGADVGADLIAHSAVDEVHITGSTETHDAIVWGRDPRERQQRRRDNKPVLEKKITSELGNVSPWIVVPGQYSQRQLHSQAQHLAASITNNASFNCLATKVIVTWPRWNQRDEFIGLIRHYLQVTARRNAYYPGALQRYRDFTGRQTDLDDRGTLPWTLLESQDVNDQPNLFTQESFVCVCAETGVSAESPTDFLRAATDFVNHQLAGTLCASVTLPPGFRRAAPEVVGSCLQQLRYGSVCINQWSGLAYGFISPPWGAYPGATLDDIQSGLGSVHNTYLLENFEKTVLAGPLVNFPKPVWFPSHRKSLSVANRLLQLYHRPSAMKLPRLFAAAATG